MISSFLRMKSLFPSKGSLFLHLLAGKARKECWQHYVKKVFEYLKECVTLCMRYQNWFKSIAAFHTHWLLKLRKSFPQEKNLSVNWKLPLQNFYSKLCVSEAKRNSYWASSYPKWRVFCRYEGQQHLVSHQAAKDWARYNANRTHLEKEERNSSEVNCRVKK